MSKTSKDEVDSSVQQYEKYNVYNGADEEAKKSNHDDMINKHWDLVTKMFEFMWGESFHLAPRWKGETLRESMKRHEHFIALLLGLKPGMKVLDVGCGIGGPLREIARFSGASRLDSCEYGVTRGKELNKAVGLDQTCDIVKGNFMNIPFPDNSFDAIYALEVVCHALDVVACYKEIYRVLKPGQCFVSYDSVVTDHYDETNPVHQKIKAEIELHNNLPNTRSTRQCLQAVIEAGFEVVWEKDLANDSTVPWYQPFENSGFSLSTIHLTGIGRFIGHILLSTLEGLKMVPEGTYNAATSTEKAAQAIVEGGKKEIFTTMYTFVVRKPL